MEETIKLETQAGGMMQMAEMMAPGTMVYKSLQEKCEKSQNNEAILKLQLEDANLEIKKLKEELMKSREETSMFRDLYNQLVGQQAVLSKIIIISIKKLKGIIPKIKIEQIPFVRTILQDTLYTPNADNCNAIIDATQLPDPKADNEFRFGAGSQNTIYTK